VCRRTNVGYIGRGSGKTGACYTRNNSAHEQPADSRCNGKENVINSKTKKGEQQYGAPSVPVAKITQYRRTYKLHNGKSKREPPTPARCRAQVAVDQFFNKLGHYGYDDTKTDNIKKKRNKYKT